MNFGPGVLKKLLSAFFNTRAAGFYMLCFAAAIGTGTFIENDFGTSAAQKVIYKTWWFTLLLALFGITIAVNIVRFRMVQQRKWTLLIFHAAMIVILVGAGITRYFGNEGMMHIRENDSSNSFLSAETFLQFKVLKNAQVYQFDEPVLFASLGDNHLKESYLLGKDLIEIEVLNFIPNPVQVLDDDPDGLPTVKVVFGGAEGREEYFVSQGETRRINNVNFNFTNDLISDAINISYRNDSLLIKSNRPLAQTVMATQTSDTLYPQQGYHELKLRSLYSDGTNRFVFGDFKQQGKVHIESESRKVKNESLIALKIKMAVNGKADEVFVYGKKGMEGRPSVSTLGNLSLSIAYGAKPIHLPFSIMLFDFIMERYPGTDNAASFASQVQLIDERKNLKQDYRIYMNNILNYDGYRFFQSSYDDDEMGTYLSVNQDFWGTWISYCGYALLTIGMILTLFSSKSRFRHVAEKISQLRAGRGALMLVAVFILLGNAKTISAQRVIDQSIQSVVAQEHAEEFSRLVVQDQRGRMKPIHTLTREVMRKLAKKESLFGLSADQIVLSMYVSNRDWYGVPIIKLGEHEAIRKQIGASDDLVAYKDFFAQSGEYLLQDEVRRAYSMAPIDRGAYEKELMKVDEKVNIANMVFSGHLFKIIPIPDDPKSTWVSSHVPGNTGDKAVQTVATKFFTAYAGALREAITTNNYSLPNQLLNELEEFQKVKGGAVMLSPIKVNAEILLNQLNVFTRLSVFYALLGCGFLFFLFFSVFKPDVHLKTVYKVLFTLTFIGFLFHTLGLGLRWYVSGRAPWSNGYESMIYIAWTTTLAGLLFTRKSFGGLAATMVLAATVLLVAYLSYLDPEITPLVPVLKSYWLTIHVSMEAGSYGFLMLGAVVGLINLILMVFITEKSRDNVLRIIREMSYVSEMTLIAGLFTISIGTYLGGVWANESWGRYWGWDAKETWALVTILVYAFILHMRIIPKMQGLYIYNVATIFGMASVIMTYFGVNYYLSGLHSYAAGDPVPVPKWVYVVALAIFLISSLAYWKKRTHRVIL